MSEGTVSLSMEQFQELLAAQANSTKEMMLELLKVAKNPSAAEQAEIDKKKQWEASAIESARQQLVMEDQAKHTRQTNCDHRKENGKWATGGQIIGGRYALLLCQHCFKPWYTTFSPENMAQLNAGDLTLTMCSPEGWKDSIAELGINN